MNWGYKILMLYTGFILMMSSFVYISSKQTNDMQDENYYVKELKYQEVIDGKNNLQALNQKVSIMNNEDNIRLNLPAEAIGEDVQGSIRVLCPSDKKRDAEILLDVDAKGEQLISPGKFKRGYYTVQINWTSAGQPYYHEETLILGQ